MFPYEFGIDGPLSATTELQYILKTLHFFENLVREEASDQRLPSEIIRALQPCRGCIILAKDAFFCTLFYAGPDDQYRNLHTVDRRELTIDIKQAESQGIRHILSDRSHGDPLTFRFPIECMDTDDRRKQDLLMPIVQKYLVFEVSWAKQRGLLTLAKPFFPGKHFTRDIDLVFVLMPFAAEFEEIYLGCVKPVVEKYVKRCVRADDIFHNKPIVEVVWKNINKAVLVVADLTSKNPNVFYEVGIAHTIGKEVILLAQTLDDVPFDLQHLNVIVYKWTPPGAEKLKVALGATIKAILERERRR